MKLLCLLVGVILASTRAESRSSAISRDDFPEDFVFGSGTSAYQVEGAAAEDGRTPSIWDTFTHANATGHVKGTGDIASDGYHKYKGDLQLIGEMGLEGYRFSISWSRLIPDGRGKINLKALDYYNNFINGLVRHGIQPHVTLIHFDTPQVLEDEYGGWLNPRIVEDFTAYANVCFREFGDRVLHWTTINEANVFAIGGYSDGFFPPGRCSYPYGNCSSGNSILEPYIVAHNFLLAHTSAAILYKNNYQHKQQGFVGLNLIAFNMLPQSNSTEDITATKRAQDFFVGWFVEPCMYGDYPKSMKDATGKKMPQFTEKQRVQLKNACDFIGVNYYVTVDVLDNPNNMSSDQRTFIDDCGISFGEEIGMGGKASSAIGMSPYGLQGVLELFKQSYGNLPVYVHENGFPLPTNSSLDDSSRVESIEEHLSFLRDALRNGSNARGYFIWSFLDVFELFGGYDYTYGLYQVDFGDKERTRYPKLSAQWYSNFLRRQDIDIFNANDSSLYVA